MSMRISMAQACAKCGVWSWGAALRNMALVTCPCAFRLRRLAQNVGCGLGIHLGRGNLVEIRTKASLRGLASRS